MTLANGVLNHAVGKRAADADVNVELTRRGFLGMAMAGVPVESAGRVTGDSGRW